MKKLFMFAFCVSTLPAYTQPNDKEPTSHTPMSETSFAEEEDLLEIETGIYVDLEHNFWFQEKIHILISDLEDRPLIRGFYSRQEIDQNTNLKALLRKSKHYLTIGNHYYFYTEEMPAYTQPNGDKPSDLKPISETSLVVEDLYENETGIYVDLEHNFWFQEKIHIHISDLEDQPLMRGLYSRKELQQDTNLRALLRKSKYYLTLDNHYYFYIDELPEQSVMQQYSLGKNKNLKKEQQQFLP
jgi:hypothetical protein